MKEWEDNFLMGITEIDEQHTGFFNLVRDELNNTDTTDPEKMMLIILRLEAYIKEHIMYEEELLEKSNYVDLENHKNQHHYFIQKVESMKLELDYLNLTVYDKLIDFMKKWFLSHIINSDKKFEETVKNYLDIQQA